VWLKAGESKEVSVTVIPKYLSIFDDAANEWKLVPGRYTFLVGGSSQELPLHETVELK
jgi:beta-glucosidase